MRVFGFRSRSETHRDWSRCVLPRPTLPWRKNGLYAFPGASAVPAAAAQVKRLHGPTTKLSKVYLGFSPRSLATRRPWRVASAETAWGSGGGAGWTGVAAAADAGRAS